MFIDNRTQRVANKYIDRLMDGGMILVIENPEIV